MKQINLLHCTFHDGLYHVFNDMPIRRRREYIENFLKTSNLSEVLPKGAVLTSDDWIPAENPNPSLYPRLAVPFVVGYQYHIRQKPCDGIGYFLAAVKVGGEEKLLFSQVNGDSSHLRLLSKNELRFPEESDKVNYRGL